VGATWRSLLHDRFEFVAAPKRFAGWIRRDVTREVKAELVADPEDFIRTPNAVVLKNRPKSMLFARTVRGKGGIRLRVVIKRVHYASVMRRVGFLFAVSPALRSLRGALILQGKGFDTPPPIAAIETRCWALRGTSYYLAEEMKDGESLRVFWQGTLAALPRQFTLRQRRRVLRDAAGLFHKLHSSGIYHQDLKGTNILLREDRLKQSYRFFLVDVGDVLERRRVPRKERVRNLVQMCEMPGRFWLPRERALFLKCYADRCGLSKDERKTLVHDVCVRTRLHKRANRGVPALSERSIRR